MTVESPGQRQVDYCCDRRHFGLFYAGDRYRCWRHASDQERQLVVELDRRAEGRIPRAQSGYWQKFDWPYGPNVYVEARRRMLEWAEAHDLRLSPTSRLCLHWLRRGRCYRYNLNHPDRKDHYNHDDGDFTHHWMDHVTAWNRDGKPGVLVAQPYGLSEQSRATLRRLDAEPDLRVEIRGDSWYGAGTTFVGVWRVYPDLSGRTQ